jgi:acyl dehydratase
MMTTLDADLTRLQVGDALPPASRRARNTSAASENKIHEDSVARDYGFRGGLVPGATTYAYLASYLTDQLGPGWAAQGTATVSLVRPVYEGDTIRIGGVVVEVEGNATRGRLTLECGVDGPDGARCAPATATMSWGETPTPEPRPAWADPTLTSRRPEERGPISAAIAPVGEPLPPVLWPADPAALAAYLADIEETNPLFRDGSPYGGALVHPGWYPNIANRVLSGNFRLGPWIHTRSEIRHLRPAIAGGVYRAYGQITAAFEKRGHEYVTADILIADMDDQPVARLLHTAIVVVARRS